MKITVLGSGAWGTALGNVLSDNKHEVLLYGRNINEVNEINSNHTNSKYLKDIKLNGNLKSSNDIKYSLDEFNPEVILIATPSSTLEFICNEIKKYNKGNVLIINVSKGLDKVTFSPLSDTIKNYLKDFSYKDVVSLIGPSFAQEVASKELTLVSAVSKNIKYSKIVQELFSNSYFRVYTNDDEIGAEYAACIKNVIAIASGIATGLGYKDNAKAALITRGLHEMCKFGIYKGAKKETFLGLTGIGDLFLTCSSFSSRNFSFGYEIGKKDDAKEIMENNKRTVEGINACKFLNDACKEYGIEMPITQSLYNVLFLNKIPSQEIKLLMERELKKEF